MKTLEYINKQFPNKVNITRKSFSKKKFCKFTRGEHKFILVIPKYLMRIEKIRKMSIDEFYDFWNNRNEGFMTKYNSFYYECELCGKQDYKYIKKI